MGTRPNTKNIEGAALALVAIALVGSAPDALAQADPADAWAGEEPDARSPTDDDDPIVPRRPRPDQPTLVPVEPRALPEAELDPTTSDEDEAWDPADQEEGLEAREHVVTGLPPLSANVECAEGTSERRSDGNEGAELWCVDDRGRRQGPWVRLWETGAPRLRGSYEGGRRHGVFLAWHPSGRLAARTPYARGLRQGVEERWYESGARKAETAFKDDREHGTQQLYFESGQLQVTGRHSMGTPVGRWAWYAEDGSLLREREYDGVGGVLTEELGEPAAAAGARSVTLASAAGAASGAFVGIPLGLILGAAGASAGNAVVGLLIFFALPPLMTGIGAAIGAALFSPMPIPIVVGVASAAAMPVGALAGATCGFLVAALLFGDTGVADAAVWGGLALGGLAGALASPAGAGALAAWFFAPAADSSE